MTERLAVTIARQRARIVREAAERLADDPKADVAVPLKTIEMHDKLLASLPQSIRKRLLPAGIVGLICLFIVGVLWAWLLPTTRIALVVDAEFVELQLESQLIGSAALVPGSLIRLVDFSTIEIPVAAGKIRKLTGDPSVEIEDGQGSLSNLRLAEGGTLQVERVDGGRVHLVSRGAPFAGDFSLWGDPLVSILRAGNTPSEQTKLELPDAELGTFRAEGRGGVPARIEFSPAVPMILAGLRVNRLTFARAAQDKPGQPVFSSTIIGGKVMLADLGTVVELAAGERLTLSGVSGSVEKIWINNDKTTVEFTGFVNRIAIGAGDKTPSVIEYIYHSKPLLFFWSAVTFLGGTLWSARKFLLP